MPKLQPFGSWGQLHYSNSGGIASATFALNGAASAGYSVNWLAYAFISLLGGTVSKIRVYANAVNGTLAAGDLVCDLYSDSAGFPSSSLQSSSTVTTVPTGAAWVEFTGFSTALTVGTTYWIVLRNADSAPTTNYPTYINFTTLAMLGSTADPGYSANLVYTSTNSGGAWTRTLAAGAFVIDYGSGDIEGIPLQSITTSDPQIYASREGGIKFTTPANSGLNVIGVAGVLTKNGTPTGDLRYRIYSGSGSSPTLLGTTVTRPPASINTSRTPKPLYFSSVINIPASTIIRVVASETTQTDTSGNRYHLEQFVLSSTDTGILVPYTTQPELTLSTDGGATFTDTANRWPGIWLILDGNAPFGPPIPTGSRFNGGMN